MQHISKSLHKGKHTWPGIACHILNTRNISWKPAHEGRAHRNTHNSSTFLLQLFARFLISNINPESVRQCWCSVVMHTVTSLLLWFTYCIFPHCWFPCYWEWKQWGSRTVPPSDARCTNSSYVTKGITMRGNCKNRTLTETHTKTRAIQKKYKTDRTPYITMNFVCVLPLVDFISSDNLHKTSEWYSIT
jgi:hypothetical protein